MKVKVLSGEGKGLLAGGFGAYVEITRRGVCVELYIPAVLMCLDALFGGVFVIFQFLQ